MTATDKLGLELLANQPANQTLANATFAQLNQLVMPSVVDKDLATPPGSPTNEALYIVAASGTGDWAGKDGQLAYWLTTTGVWQFVVPAAGFAVRVLDELDGAGLPKIYAHSGSAWVEQPTSGFTGGTLTSALNEAPITTLASAATIDVGAEAANTISISGTTTVTSLGTIASGAVRRLVFQGILTLTHNATSLILPTGANITTAPGDIADFVSLGSGNWRCVGYQRADGTPLAGAGGSFTGGTLTSALNEAPAVTIASAATVNIGAAAANSISVTGTTAITAFDTVADGAVRRITFAAALTLTHNATSLILPTGANITTVAGDVAEFLSLGAGNWRCINYQRADGSALSGGGGGGLTYLTETKTTASPNATIPVVSLSVTITETNGDIAIIPKGTGAILAAIPNSAASGGNKRGTYSVDLQRDRASQFQVASGSYSFIGNGKNNTAEALYSTVVAGLTNYAAGQYSFVGGGESNTANGTWSACPGGKSNVVTGDYSTISGGQNNATSAPWAVVAGGNGGTASGQYSGIGGGQANLASGQWSYIPGGAYASTRGLQGMEARANGRFSATGDAQRGRYILRQATSNATPAAVTADTLGAGTTNQVVLPNTSAYKFTGSLVARENATGDCAAWEFKGVIRRGASAATTALVAAVTPTSVAADAGAAAWSIAVTADTTNGGLTVTVTGEAAKTIRWVADIETVEVVG